MTAVTSWTKSAGMHAPIKLTAKKMNGSVHWMLHY